jgi:ADP-heptose:LPS heptosyltransferase
LPSTQQRATEILLHPGAAAPARRWPPDRWARVAAELTSAGHPVTLTGSAAEGALCSQIVSMAGDLGPVEGRLANTAGGLLLPELAARVSGARLLVCGDTGVGHLATAYGTPSVLLFGPTSPRRWGPVIDTDLHVVLWRGRDERPGDPHGSELDPALAAIDVDDVLVAVRTLLGGDHS